MEYNRRKVKLRNPVIAFDVNSWTLPLCCGVCTARFVSSSRQAITLLCILDLLSIADCTTL